MESIAELLSKMSLPGQPPTLDQMLSHKDVRKFLQDHPGIPNSVIKNSKSRLNEYINALNKVHETGMEPVLVMNYGFIDCAYRPSTTRLRLIEERKKASLLINHSMSEAIKAASFEKMQMTKERYELIKYIREFATEYITDSEGLYQGAFVSGGYGIGKTYILSALANHLAKHGKNVRIEHFPTFVNELKQKIATNEVMTEVKKLMKSEFLIIDDFGAEKLTEWLRDDVILVILEYRMNNILPTFITSNLTMEETREYLSRTKEGVDYRKADRIMERIKYLTKEIKLVGTNKRNPD